MKYNTPMTITPPPAPMLTQDVIEAPDLFRLGNENTLQCDKVRGMSKRARKAGLITSMVSTDSCLFWL